MSALTTRVKKSQNVVAEIERLIRKSAFQPGERLPSEAELAQQLNVGRPSVREALFVLQHRGLVDVQNGSRALVTQPTADFLIQQISDVAMALAKLPDGQHHLEETRLIFESGMAWLAAQKATDADIETLREALDANVRAVGVVEEFVKTDVAFHCEIARISGNPIFDSFHNVLTEWLIKQRTMTVRLPDADSLSVRDHTEIFKAIAARDPARAYHVMAGHLRLISELYAEATRLNDTLLRQMTRDVAARTGEENAQLWKASFPETAQTPPENETANVIAPMGSDKPTQDDD